MGFCWIVLLEVHLPLVVQVCSSVDKHSSTDIFLKVLSFSITSLSLKSLPLPGSPKDKIKILISKMKSKPNRLKTNNRHCVLDLWNTKRAKVKYV